MIPSNSLSLLRLKKKYEIWKTVQDKKKYHKSVQFKGIANYFNMQILRQYI